MRIDCLTLFPEMFSGPLDFSIIARARKKGFLDFRVHNLRNWAKDKHKQVDDRPYGGGEGMVLMPQPIFDAVADLKNENRESKVVLLSPQGAILTQEKASGLSKEKGLILICGHYEGVDERVVKYLVDEEISIGDFILTGGELPAMILVDTIGRLLPGVLKLKEATKHESFSLKDEKGNALLEYPQYTRPSEFRGHKVPGVLLGGDHQKIAQWRLKKAIERTGRKAQSGL